MTSFDSTSAASNLGTTSSVLSGESRRMLGDSFVKNGYVVLENVVDRRALATVASQIRREYDDARASGRLFSGGGTISGHLNCFPGEASRFVLQALTEAGVVDLVHELSPRPLRQPNVGCNLNLPGSSSQNEHVDGYAAEPFLVINVAAVDTDLSNGAMEILCGTHHRDYQYWEVMLARIERRRLVMKQGDVVIRTSALWHRGMANPSSLARPMLAFTWENGGNDLPDPYSIHGGRITLLPNRHPLDWKGRLRERAYVTAPRVGTAFRIAQSLVASLTSR